MLLLLAAAAADKYYIFLNAVITAINHSVPILTHIAAKLVGQRSVYDAPK